MEGGCYENPAYAFDGQDFSLKFPWTLQGSNRKPAARWRWNSFVPPHNMGSLTGKWTFIVVVHTYGVWVNGRTPEGGMVL